MLGNFSFGDYFKEEALHFAWSFLTEELGLPMNRLIVTVYHSDEEAQSIWRKIAGNITIIPISTTDNFWSMGDTGPCGPCSEVFYDHGENVPGGIPGSPDQDGDRYMEIWNIVFMQFEQMQNGERVSLQKKSIDTGMGLERVSAIMQGMLDNYLTDLFREIISEVKSISGTNFVDTYPSYKVIADHIRSVSFLIADGVLPSNEGRGYVLRRILRRAMRHGHLINLRDPFLFKLSDSLVNTMKDAYPELEKARGMISNTIYQEEEKFLITLDRGLKILQNDLKDTPAGSVLDGSRAFKLYDTYGFPLDLTQDILKSENIEVDVAGFEVALQEQKQRTRWAGSGEKTEKKIWLNLREKHGVTDFVGYDADHCNSEVLSLVGENEEEVSRISQGRAFIVTRSTPFYAECGGQCGDTGLIKVSTGTFKVTDTKKYCDGLIVHVGEVDSGYLEMYTQAHLALERERREKIRANHTATHLLQSALRNVLGDHVVQRGSFLNDDRLRFDFSHSSALSADVIKEVETIVNYWIRRDMQLLFRIMTKDEAISAGAMALFGEKYADVVRTVSIIDIDRNNETVSFELCGGTHVATTGHLGMFKIISEASIGSGIRRIEAITGAKVLEYIRQMDDVICSLEGKFHCCMAELPGKIDDLLLDFKRKNREILLNRQMMALERVHEVSQPGGNVYTLIVSDYGADELRSIGDVLHSQKPAGVSIIANHDRGSDKVFLMVRISPDLQEKYHAGHLLQHGLPFIGGKGGGNAASAMGGGFCQDGISTAISTIVAQIL
jgi:alanyl-tRNA synthetase